MQRKEREKKESQSTGDNIVIEEFRASICHTVR
jgi:hypothetical protein